MIMFLEDHSECIQSEKCMVTKLTVHTMYMDTMNDDDMQCSCMDAFLSLLSLLI